jgi:hypothetical protein
LEDRAGRLVVATAVEVLRAAVFGVKKLEILFCFKAWEEGTCGELFGAIMATPKVDRSTIEVWSKSRPTNDAQFAKEART